MGDSFRDKNEKPRLDRMTSRLTSSYADKSGAVVSLHLLDESALKIMSQANMDRLCERWLPDASDSEKLKFKNELLKGLMEKTHQVLEKSQGYYGKKDVNLTFEDIYIRDDNTVDVGYHVASIDKVKIKKLGEFLPDGQLIPFDVDRLAGEIAHSKEFNSSVVMKPVELESDHIAILSERNAKLQDKQDAVNENLAAVKSDFQNYIKQQFLQKVDADEFKKMNDFTQNGEITAPLLQQENRAKRDEIVQAFTSNTADKAKELGIPTFEEFYKKLGNVLVKLTDADILTLGLQKEQQTQIAQEFHECFAMLDKVGIYHAGGRPVNFWSGLEGQKKAREDKSAISDSDVPANDVMFRLWELIKMQEASKGQAYLTSRLPSAICGVFASNAQGNVNVYLSSNRAEEPAAIIAHNIFWNAELPALEQRKRLGLVEHIQKNKFVKLKDESVGHWASDAPTPILRRSATHTDLNSPLRDDPKMFEVTGIRRTGTLRSLKKPIDIMRKKVDLAKERHEVIQNLVNQFNGEKDKKHFIKVEFSQNDSEFEMKISGGETEDRKNFAKVLNDNNFKVGISRKKSTTNSLVLVIPEFDIKKTLVNTDTGVKNQQETPTSDSTPKSKSMRK